MSTPRLITVVRDVLDPLTGTRHDLRWAAGKPVATGTDAGREIDGTELWILPAIYDADAHMPFVTAGVRAFDRQRALAGGVAQMNVALPWQQIQAMDLAALVADLTRDVLPRIIPLLSVSPDDSSAGFPAWLAAHAGEVKMLLPSVCKLYSYDPYFDANLDAVLAAGLKPMVWCSTEDGLDHVIERIPDGPLHLRHATSAAMLATMRRAAGATVQTSPHFLLPLSKAKRDDLTVLPPPVGDDPRQSLVEACMAGIDLIASDHGAPGLRRPPGKDSPGLQVQQHFLSAILTLAELYSWDLGALLAKVTSAPARVFGVEAPQGFTLVDPTWREPVTLWPDQGSDRAPFEGMALRGRVLAVSGGGDVELV
ncbi:MAG: hypothetical protein PHS60_15070 [Zavarzinia sp.]|nr:hypothetical protein [Zavarzinia sp.]